MNPAITHAPSVPWRTAAARTVLRHPEGWVYALAGAAGVVLVGYATTVQNRATGAERSAAAFMGAWTGWMLMVFAMMLPVAAPVARQVAIRSLWSRRQRALMGYLVGYLTVWAIAGGVLVGVLEIVGMPHPPARVVVVALLVAASWQTAAPRRRVLRRCGSLQLRTARGWAADRDCCRAGCIAGLRCALTCGPVMVAMGLGHHYPVLVIALVAILLTERARGPNPQSRAGRPLEAWCLAGCAAMVAVAGMA